MIRSYLGCFCAVFINAILFYIIRSLILSVKSGTFGAFILTNKQKRKREITHSAFAYEVINVSLVLIFGLNLLLVNYIFTDYKARLIFPLFCLASFCLAHRLSKTRAFTIISSIVEKVITALIRPFAFAIVYTLIIPLRKAILSVKGLCCRNTRIKCKKINKNTNIEDIVT